MNDDTDVRDFLRIMSAEVGPLRTDPDAVARRAGARLVRTVVLGVLVVTLVAVTGFAGAEALRSPYRERPASHGPTASTITVVVARSTFTNLPAGQRFDLDGGLALVPEPGDASSDVVLVRRHDGSVLLFMNGSRVVALGHASFSTLSPSGLKGLAYHRGSSRLSAFAGEVLAVRTSEGNYSKVQVIQCCGSSSRRFIQFRFVTYG